MTGGLKSEELIISGVDEPSVKGLNDSEFGSRRELRSQTVAIKQAIVFIIEANTLTTVDTAERIAVDDKINLFVRGLSFKDRLDNIKAKLEMWVEQRIEHAKEGIGFIKCCDAVQTQFHDES